MSAWGVLRLGLGKGGGEIKKIREHVLVLKIIQIIWLN